LNRINYTVEQEFNANMSKSPGGVFDGETLSLGGFCNLHRKMHGKRQEVFAKSNSLGVCDSESGRSRPFDGHLTLE
jgi:hypothetical protein